MPITPRTSQRRRSALSLMTVASDMEFTLLSFWSQEFQCGSGRDHELARWAALEVLPGLADVVEPGLVDIQSDLPGDRVAHHARISGAAHFGGRCGDSLTAER